jgi:hypothetical protein
MEDEVMSVIKSQRGLSEMEFLNNARKLEIYTIRRCVNTIPKRYTFYLGQHLADAATQIYANTKKANSIYPTNAREVQIRREFFLKAYVECQNLVSQIEVAYELIHFETKVLEEWSELIATQINLIKGAMTKDRKRFQKFLK